MSNVLIVPEKNEGLNPLKVVEEGLKSKLIDEVYVIDGWSTDNTADLLEDELLKLARKYGKNVAFHRAELRNAGKGGAMVTGMKIALESGHSNVLFADADITSITSKWFDLLVNGIRKYGVDITRGYYDRSPFDAQITRHITRPLINMFFPEGRGINQPLGGELCMTRSFVQRLLDYHIAPPHTWGIDTFITVIGLVESFNTAELYLSQKAHKKKTTDELKSMVLECFDEIAKQIFYHKRDKMVPLFEGVTYVRIIPKSESDIERIGEDVRTAAFVNFESEISSLSNLIKEREIYLELLNELDISEEDQVMISRLLHADFREKSKLLDAKKWVHLLHGLVQGYINRQFDSRYHDLIYTVWKLRTLAFCLNEAGSFEDAEENTKKQAEYAFKFGQTRLTKGL
jgi:glycosyltransferase involved in cell wall biosynthesis